MIASCFSSYYILPFSLCVCNVQSSNKKTYPRKSPHFHTWARVVTQKGRQRATTGRTVGMRNSPKKGGRKKRRIGEQQIWREDVMGSARGYFLGNK
jgi:hypothetical protein